MKPPAKPYQPVLVAHRGLHDRWPENSLAAFGEARDLSLPWVECDVWPSADGVPVVIHDETLDRTTTGKGLVWWQRWERLRFLRLRHPDGRGDESSRLPTLEELTALGGPSLLVEVKPPDSHAFVREVIRILESRCGRRGRWRLQSFDEANLVHAVTGDIDLPVAFLIDSRESLERGLAHGWQHLYLRHDLLDEPTADRMREKGVAIGVWTPTREEDLRRVIELRADVIITDDPVRAALLIRST